MVIFTDFILFLGEVSGEPWGLNPFRFGNNVTVEFFYYGEIYRMESEEAGFWIGRSRQKADVFHNGS